MNRNRRKRSPGNHWNGGKKEINKSKRNLANDPWLKYLNLAAQKMGNPEIIHPWKYFDKIDRIKKKRNPGT